MDALNEVVEENCVVKGANLIRFQTFLTNVCVQSSAIEEPQINERKRWQRRWWLIKINYSPSP